MKLKAYERALIFAAAVIIAFTAGFIIGRKTASTRVIVESAPPEVSTVRSASDKALININTADSEELSSLPGIGETLSEVIISYRDKNGPFKSIGEIINVEGVGPGIYEQIRDLITV